MSIKLDNVLLLSLEPTHVDDISISRQDLKQLKPEDFRDVPVFIKRGAVNHKVGKIMGLARISRNRIYGDVVLNLSGSIELKLLYDEDGEVIGVKPARFVYVKK